MLLHSRTGDRTLHASTQAPHRCPFNIPTCPGCHAESRIEGHPNPHDEVSDDHANGLQVEVCSPATARLQLREEFRHIFFPAPYGRDADFMYCRFLGGKCLQPQGASMTAAVDLLCLLQMGARKKDQTLLQEASNLYDLTLANLKIDLERPNAAQNDGMVAAIWILHWCDSFTPTRGTPWSTQIHKQAAEHILVSRGPNAELSELAQLLLYNVRLTGTSFGMISRKPVLSAGHGWAKRAAWAGTIENELIETLLQIPDLLYRLDKLATQRGRPKYYDTYSVLQEFTHMEEELISWLTRWMRSLPGEVFHNVCTSSFPHLQLLTQTVTDVFHFVIEYPSFATASLQMTYWTGLMQVKWSIMELLDLLQDHSLI